MRSRGALLRTARCLRLYEGQGTRGGLFRCSQSLEREALGQTARADVLAIVDYISDDNPGSRPGAERRYRGQGGKAGATS